MTLAFILLQLAIITGLLVVIARKPIAKPYFAGVFDPNKDVTTAMPIPLDAATCQHDWETITDKVLEIDHAKRHVLVMKCHRCGAVDKTITTVSPKKFDPSTCTHDWEKVSEQNLDTEQEKHYICLLKCNKCGALDKTEHVAKLPDPPGPCRHKWVKEKSTILNSAYEQMLKSLPTKTVKQGYNSRKEPDGQLDLELDKAPKWMFRKTVVEVRLCLNCGAIHETTAANYELDEGEEEESNDD